MKKATCLVYEWSEVLVTKRVLYARLCQIGSRGKEPSAELVRDEAELVDFCHELMLVAREALRHLEKDNVK